MSEGIDFLNLYFPLCFLGSTLDKLFTHKFVKLGRYCISQMHDTQKVENIGCSVSQFAGSVINVMKTI